MKKLLLILILLALCFPVVMAVEVITPSNYIVSGSGYAAKSLFTDGTHDLYLGDTITWTGCSASGCTPTRCKNYLTVNYAPNNTAPVNPSSASGSFVINATNHGEASCIVLYVPSLGHYFWQVDPTYRPYANVTFSISDSANFTAKLSGVAILLSNGQTNTTGADGTAFIAITPISSAYTYDLTKSSYTDVNARSLGGYGITGGTVYDTMTYAVITTPTPVPTYPPTPAGYIRTIVRTVDGNTGTRITGATINLRDVSNNSWKNSTADSDGESYIDTLPSSTMDVYCTHPTGAWTASSETGASVGGVYLMPMYPPLLAAGDGNINLVVGVYDIYGNSLPGASVTVRVPSGATTGGITGPGGSETFNVVNNSVVTISASKSGYVGKSWSVTTNTFADQWTEIKLDRQTQATTPPTLTPGPEGTTPMPTIIPGCEDPTSSGCANIKDTALMNQLRDAGPSIVGLAILAIIFGILKMIMKF